MLRIQIVDDHKMVVKSLSQMIDQSGIAQVTGKYFDLKSCREGLKKKMPDILLLDIELPDGDGVEFCEEIIREYPELKVIMLTCYKEFNIAKRALNNGAKGYILKNAELEEFLTGIKTVNNGNMFLCDEIEFLLREKKDTDVIWLTNREKEVLKHITDGYTTAEIAKKIHRNNETVKSHRRNLFIKFKVKNVAELTKRAYAMRFVK